MRKITPPVTAYGGDTPLVNAGGEGATHFSGSSLNLTLSLKQRLFQNGNKPCQSCQILLGEAAFYGAVDV